MNITEMQQKILELKKEKDFCILAHVYENREIVEIADYILAKGLLKKDVERVWKDKRIYIIPHKTYHQQFFLIKGDNGKVVEVPDSAILIY